MASYLPSDSYPREQGVFWGRCGSTWNREIEVTGWIQSLRFGDQFAVDLQPLATDEEVAAVGRDSAEERQLFQYLDGRRQYFAGLAATVSYLKPAQRASIQELLDRADELVELIGDIYRKWERFPCFIDLGEQSPVCAWPLSWADNVGAWRKRCGELPFEPGKSYSAFDATSGTQRTFTCPISPGSPLARLDGTTRAQDREQIRDITKGVLHHLRCAHYTLNRLKLYSQAWREYRDSQMKGTWVGLEPPEEEPETLGFGGLKADIPPGVDPNDFLPDPPTPGEIFPVPADLDFDFDPPGEKDEEDPSELPEPDPDSLPPWDQGPDAEGAPDTGAPGAASASDDTHSRTLKYGAIGLGAVAVGAIIYKGIKK